MNSYSRKLLHRFLFQHLKKGAGIDDATFDQIYPTDIRDVSKRHWTPVAVAKRAAEYLVSFPGARVLDIGSGAGKFCLLGAANTEGNFVGVERRERLVTVSATIQKRSGLKNARFVMANINMIDFGDFDSFYFYNSFFENFEGASKIDHSVEVKPELYKEYSEFVRSQLDDQPRGTRLVTYWSSQLEVPKSYELKSTEHSGLLRFWERI